MSSRRVTMLLMAAVFLVGLAFVVLRPHAPSSGRLSTAERHWQERIAAIGGKAAYAEFGTSVANETVPQQHISAHAFGKALYLTEGISGLTVCDANYTMGCMHEFFSEAIVDKGLGAGDGLLEACYKEFPNPHDQGECRHSLGHGFLSYLGYGSDDLMQALTLCGKVPQENTGGGCRDGVFMEYNERFFLGPDMTLRAPTDDPLAPCDSLSGKDAQACAYWQPNWWWKAASTSQKAATFSKIGAYCAELAALQPDTATRCYEGTGYAAAWASRFEATTTAAYCDSAFPSGGSRLSCRKRAAFTFGLHAPAAAESLCGVFAGADLKECMAYADRTPATLGETPTDPEGEMQKTSQ